MKERLASNKPVLLAEHLKIILSVDVFILELMVPTKSMPTTHLFLSFFTLLFYFLKVINLPDIIFFLEVTITHFVTSLYWYYIIVFATNFRIHFLEVSGSSACVFVWYIWLFSHFCRDGKFWQTKTPDSCAHQSWAAYSNAFCSYFVVFPAFILAHVSVILFVSALVLLAKNERRESEKMVLCSPCRCEDQSQYPQNPSQSCLSSQFSYCEMESRDGRMPRRLLLS